ncbi:ribosomal protein uS13 [Candidatus Vidania fulgoroideorum]
MKIMNVNIPEGKKVCIGLTYIFGIGRARAKEICEALCLNKQVRHLTNKDIENIVHCIRKYKIEEELKQEIMDNIKTKMLMKTYKGVRHERFLPVRGQRTRTNAQTRKKYKKFFFIKNG